MIIEGRKIILYIEKDGEWIATACDKSSTLNITSEFLPITDPDGARIKRRLPTYVDWSLTGEGLVDYNRLISAQFMQNSILTGLRVKINWIAVEGDQYALYEGYGYFETINEEAAVSDVATYNYTIVADSELTITDKFTKDSNEGKLFRVLADDQGNYILDGNDQMIII